MHCRLIGIVLLASLAPLAPTPKAYAQNANALNSEERARALEIEGQARERLGHPSNGETSVQGLESTPAGREARSVITSVVPLGAPVSDQAAAQERRESEPRRAEISRFDYATGATVRTTVDLGTGAVLVERSDVNYPTPLAPEELAEAKSLLAAAAPDVAAIVAAAGGLDKVKFLVLVPVAAHSGAPRYGHRLVSIWADQPKKSARYLVDLTTREVVKGP